MVSRVPTGIAGSSRRITYTPVEMSDEKTTPLASMAHQRYGVAADSEPNFASLGVLKWVRDHDLEDTRAGVVVADGDEQPAGAVDFGVDSADVVGAVGVRVEGDVGSPHPLCELVARGRRRAVEGGRPQLDAILDARRVDEVEVPRVAALVAVLLGAVAGVGVGVGVLLADDEQSPAVHRPAERLDGVCPLHREQAEFLDVARVAHVEDAGARLALAGVVVGPPVGQIRVRVARDGVVDDRDVVGIVLVAFEEAEALGLVRRIARLPLAEFGVVGPEVDQLDVAGRPVEPVDVHAGGVAQRAGDAEDVVLAPDAVVIAVVHPEAVLLAAEDFGVTGVGDVDRQHARVLDVVGAVALRTGLRSVAGQRREQARDRLLCHEQVLPVVGELDVHHRRRVVFVGDERQDGHLGALELLAALGSGGRPRFR
ncbi:hypothetical protein BRC88_01970 [Halobacteriales archaeon QS_4_69_225]|nr:MAG: hypothetical protein BRC88_01970 [Halobacteriales archaeon QS_4_69_225]